MSIHVALTNERFLLKYINKKTNSVAHKSIIVSTLIAGFTAIGCIVAVSHHIQSMLNTFDQIMFHNAMSVCFFSAAITDVTSSGTDVPIATMLAQISTVETLNIRARLLACVTNASHQIYNQKAQSTTRKYEYGSVNQTGAQSTSISLFFAATKSCRKNHAKNRSNIIPSVLERTESVVHHSHWSLIIMSSINAAQKLTGSSLKSVDGFTARAVITAVIPHISIRFDIFDHTMFANMSHVSQRNAAIMFTNNSGADVHTAKMVIHTIRGGIS